MCHCVYIRPLEGVGVGGVEGRGGGWRGGEGGGGEGGGGEGGGGERHMVWKEGNFVIHTYI